MTRMFALEAMTCIAMGLVGIPSSAQVESATSPLTQFLKINMDIKLNLTAIDDKDSNSVSGNCILEIHTGRGNDPRWFKEIDFGKVTEVVTLKERFEDPTAFYIVGPVMVWRPGETDKRPQPNEATFNAPTVEKAQQLAKLMREQVAACGKAAT